MQKLTLGLLALVALLLALAPAAAQDGLPGFEPLSRCPFVRPDGTRPECGYLIVPEDHFDPANTNTIKVFVARFPATGDAPRPDPLVYLEGGPGGNPSELLQFTYADLFQAFNVEREVIIVDQRGTGYSQPDLECDEITDWTYDTLDVVLSADEITQQRADVLQACYDRLTADGVDVTRYTSRQNAADIAALRVALGYDAINLYGISYGTKLALTVMRDFPDGIRSVIIDSVYPLDVTLFSAPLNAHRAFETLFAGCAADSVCNGTYPDLRKVFYDTVTLLNDEPSQLVVLDAASGSLLPAKMDGYAFIGLVFQALYSADLIPLLPGAIYDASGGSYTLFTTLFSNTLFQQSYISDGMYQAVQCGEETLLTTPDDFRVIMAQLPPELDGFVADNDYDVAVASCAAWGIRAGDPLDNQPVSSDIRTLVVSGEYDPITPPAWAQQAAQTLGNSVYYNVPNAGHGATPTSACTTQVALDFLNDLNSDPDVSCVDALGAPKFITPDTPVTLVDYSNPSVGVSTVIPEGWSESSPGVIAAPSGDVLLFLPVPLPLDQFIPAVQAQLGLDDLQPIERYDAANGLTWDIYQVEFQGFPTLLAVVEIDGVTYSVQLVTATGSVERGLTQILKPVLDAFAVLG